MLEAAYRVVLLPRELSLHFLERIVRRHAKKSLHTNLLAWRLRAKHTAVSAVAGAAKRRYEDFLRLDARCAALVAEAARRAEVQRLRLLLLRAPASMRASGCLQGGTRTRGRGLCGAVSTRAVALSAFPRDE